ncbi:MAG: BglII/BstYI family type II restriction endonuclease [Thermoplasmata archaeon]
MIVAAEYSFNKGKEIIKSETPDLMKEIIGVIDQINADECKNKESREKTMRGELLYSPRCLNDAFKNGFKSKGWDSVKIKCDYSSEYYTPDFLKKVNGKPTNQSPFREMDFVKKSSQNNKKIGIEVQFGKYAFMVYNVAAKMTIFRNLGYIDYGVEIVPVKKLADEMSTGVSFFEQFVWDLEQRGTCNIDIPVWVIGVYP